MRVVKPLDEALLRTLAADHDGFVTVEENVVAGGAGSAVAELLASAGLARPVLHLGFPDRILEHGEPSFLMTHIGLDADGIAASIRERFGALLA